MIPFYNEEACIPAFLERINDVFSAHDNITLEMVFVNDGSTDTSLALLKKRMRQDRRIIIVDLSRNFGKEAALSAGLKEATGEAVIPLDADLQDPPELILAMIAKWQQGHDVVLARRIRRNEDSWFKRVSARYFYRIHNKFSQPKLPENVGDFRLMDRRVVDALNALPESCRFMKGLFAWVGFRTAYIDYCRPARVSGASKFKAWKLWNFALDGITSFTTAPLRIWTYIGAFFTIVSFLFACFIFLRFF